MQFALLASAPLFATAPALTHHRAPQRGFEVPESASQSPPARPQLLHTESAKRERGGLVLHCYTRSTIRPRSVKFSLQSADGGGKLCEDLGRERPCRRGEPTVGKLLGERYGAERSPLTDIDATGRSTTREKDQQLAAHQRVERVPHDEAL
jgi:hypothetical protein